MLVLLLMNDDVNVNHDLDEVENGDDDDDDVVVVVAVDDKYNNHH